MFWIALAAAAQLSMPIPVGVRIPDVRAVFSVNDFPAYLQGAGVTRTVYTRTTVRSDGSIQGCVAEVSSGDSALDAYTCSIIVKRAKFLPAKWIDGSPTYAVVRVPVTWAINNSLPSEPDVLLSVTELPKGARTLVGVSVEIAADENGHPLTCAEYSAVQPKPRFPELVAIACQQVMASFTASPPLDASGRPVRSVQGVSVQFKRDH